MTAPRSPQLALPMVMDTRPADTALTRRALELLERGPATPQALVEYVCQMPGAPLMVAEHMASALFSGRPEFVRSADGLWAMAPMAEPRAGIDVVGPATPTAPDPLRSLSFVVVDVETTGGSPWFGHRITEYAAVRVTDGEIVDVYETLVNPERPIPIWVTKLTRISSAMVQAAPRFGEIAQRVLHTLRGGVFVGHNATYDWSYVSAEIERTTGERLIGKRLCTVKLARALRLQVRSRSLDYLADYYGVHNHARHRAAGDALATAKVFIRMLEGARDQGIESFDELEKFQRRRGGRRRKKRRPASPQPMDKDTTA